MRDFISVCARLPVRGTPAERLTDRERLALCIAAGAETEVCQDGSLIIVRTKVPCGVADRGDGGYIVAIGYGRG